MLLVSKTLFRKYLLEPEWLVRLLLTVDKKNISAHLLICQATAQAARLLRDSCKDEHLVSFKAGSHQATRRNSTELFCCVAS